MIDNPESWIHPTLEEREMIAAIIEAKLKEPKQNKMPVLPTTETKKTK